MLSLAPVVFLFFSSDVGVIPSGSADVDNYYSNILAVGELFRSNKISETLVKINCRRSSDIDHGIIASVPSSRSLDLHS